MFLAPGICRATDRKAGFRVVVARRVAAETVAETALFQSIPKSSVHFVGFAFTNDLKME
ncbi:hypothetical protein [Verminephrobacter eiseniae]|uniref:hypothetical protein n=1 Tax=Verminephrobacter eiseniae TaxID=364317 RepID=UPI002236FEFA|nr:hypothetical protein [Verminephrobacter eiseniae]